MLIEQTVDMVILAVGLEPREDAGEIAGMLGITRDDDGWFNEANYLTEPTSTFSGGVTIAGVCQAPKDIPDTVAQASAAASRVLQSIMRGKVRGSVKDIPLGTIIKNAKEISPYKLEEQS